mmetsp:Transcript_85651/g.164890  ORF Transcript_85651/g.164890 Transcript_85651/m.164890 type:complete len:227 (+) Transcript_85651:84-764(+)
MARVPSKILPLTALAVLVYSVGHFALSFIASPAPLSAGQQLRHRGVTTLQARGGGEYDVSDADIDAFYKETISGSGGDPPKGVVVSELIVKFFYGDFTPQGFVRYSGLWKGPPPGAIGKRDIKIGVERLKKFFEAPQSAFISKGGVGYGIDETQKVEDDGKGYIWVAAEMSPGGLALETFTSVPYGKRALFCAKKDNVAEMFDKINWDIAANRIEITLGGPTIKQR